MFPKRSGYMHMDKQGTQFILDILCSTRGTNIAKVEGLWLIGRPNHSVPETQTTALTCVCSPYIFPSPESMRDHCDVILWCHDCLLYSFGRKTTVHAQRKCHSSSVHLVALLPESPVTIAISKPHCLFLNPNFMPVTLSPRYFSAPSYWHLKFIYNTKHRHV